MCLGEIRTRQHGGVFRLRVAPDTDLLFHEQHLVGWMLTDPARYLTLDWENPEPSPPEPSTRTLLAECLGLTAEPLVEDVMDGDESAWHRLRRVTSALHDQLSDRERVKILSSTMDHLAQSYS